jgi:hypothetical protein
MIPMFAVVAVRHGGGRFKIWAPLFLLWLLLAPFALILTPFAALACVVMGLNPFRVAVAWFAVLTGLSGLLVQVDSPAAQVTVRVQ